MNGCKTLHKHDEMDFLYHNSPKARAEIILDNA